jgi:hypothetical protein
MQVLCFCGMFAIGTAWSAFTNLSSSDSTLNVAHLCKCTRSGLQSLRRWLV